MGTVDRSGVIRLAAAQKSIPGPSGERSTLVLNRGTFDVKFALPVPSNGQTPHSQDEIYVIFRARGVLFHDGKRESFESGDLLFVAAGAEHRLEDFTDDVALWRVFYGALGGEVPESAGRVRQH